MSTAVAVDIRQEVKAPSLYERMKRETDPEVFRLVLWTIQRYNPEMARERAEQLLDAFLQWISLAALNTPERFVTMLQTDVEEVWHCFVLNTELYGPFSEEYLGFFLHHRPITAAESGPEVAEWVRYTVELAEEQYGDQLHPELQDWRRQLDEGTYHVACAGPGGHCK